MGFAGLLLVACSGESKSDTRRTDAQGDHTTSAAGDLSGQAPIDVRDNTQALCSALPPNQVVMLGYDASGSRLAIGRADGSFSLSEPLFEGAEPITRHHPVSEDPESFVFLSAALSGIPRHAALVHLSDGIRFSTTLNDATRRDSGPAHSAAGPSLVLSSNTRLLLLRVDGSWTTAEIGSNQYQARQLSPNGSFPVRAQNLGMESVADLGFYSFTERVVQPLRQAPFEAESWPSYQVLAGAPYLYMTRRDDGTLSLVIDSPDATQVIPTEIDENAFEGLRNYRPYFGDYLAVHADGAPHLLVALDSRRHQLLPEQSPGTQVAFAGDFALLHAGLPRELVSLVDGSILGLDASGLEPALTVFSRDGYLLGVDGDTPRWLVDTARGRVSAVSHAGLPDDLLAWPCAFTDSLFASTTLGGGGLISTSVRTRSAASFFVRSAESERWTQLGRSFTRVRLLHTQALGAAPLWSVAGELEHSDCGPAQPLIAEQVLAEFDAAGRPVVAPELLLPELMQVVGPNVETLSFDTDTNIAAHSSGACISITPARGPREHIDLSTGARLRLDLSWSTWL